VYETAQLAVKAAQDILRLFDTDKRRIATLGQRANSVLRLYDIIQGRPFMSAPIARKMLKDRGLPLSEPTVYTAIQHLEKLGILNEVTGKGRNRYYAYTEYMNILNEGTKPI
jgi:Fic family protein